MKCQTAQANLSAYLHGELTINKVQQLHNHLAACSSCVQEEMELRQTQHLLAQYQEISLPSDFNAQLTKKLHRVIEKKRISLTQIISSAAAAVLLTLAVQYFASTADGRQLPAHFTLFHAQQQVVVKESSWTDRLITKFFDRLPGPHDQK